MLKIFNLLDIAYRKFFGMPYDVEGGTNCEEALWRKILRFFGFNY